jgi:hypothetical protein
VISVELNMNIAEAERVGREDPRTFRRWARMAVMTKIEKQIQRGELDGQAAIWELDCVLMGAGFQDRIRAHMAGKKPLGGHFNGPH